MARARFKLLNGVHIGADFSQSPVEVYDPNTGETNPKLIRNPKTGALSYQYPSRIYRQGEELDSDLDLEMHLGADKFKKLSSPPLSQEEAPEQKGVRAGKKLKGSLGRDESEDDLNYPEKEPAVSPNGQVTSGFQKTSAGVPGPQATKEAMAEGGGSLPPKPGPFAAASAPRQSQQEKAGATTTAASDKQDFKKADLERKTVKELKELAEENEIDLGDAHAKDDIIKKFHAK